MLNYIYKYLNLLLLRYDIMCYNYHVEVKKMSKEKEILKNNNEKKKKKFKIKWSKFFVWLALLAMVGSAIIAILSPVMYKN